MRLFKRPPPLEAEITLDLTLHLRGPEDWMRELDPEFAADMARQLFIAKRREALAKTRGR